MTLPAPAAVPPMVLLLTPERDTPPPGGIVVPLGRGARPAAVGPTQGAWPRVFPLLRPPVAGRARLLDLHAVRVPGDDVARARGRATDGVIRRIVDEYAVKVSKVVAAVGVNAYEVALDHVCGCAQALDLNAGGVVVADEVALAAGGAAHGVGRRAVYEHAVLLLCRIFPKARFEAATVGADEVRGYDVAAGRGSIYPDALPVHVG